MVESKKLSQAEKITAKDFKGRTPSLKHIVGKFTPTIEMIENHGTIYFWKISRGETGAMLHCLPPTELDFAREEVIFRLKRILQAKQGV